MLLDGLVVNFVVWIVVTFRVGFSGWLICCLLWLGDLIDDDNDKNCVGSWKDGVNGGTETNSLGSWKDGESGCVEAAVESGANGCLMSGTNGCSMSDSIGMSAPPASGGGRLSWADMAQEDELGGDEESEVMSRLSIVNSSSGDGIAAVKSASKPVLSRDQREYIRFTSVKRKKDFACFERINMKLVNILDGLELHTGVFSAAEQKRIVDYVYELEEMGKNGKLKGQPNYLINILEYICYILFH